MKKYLPIFLIFIFALFVRIFWAVQIDYMYVDSPITFSISSPNTLQDGKPFKLYWDNYDYKLNHQYTALELKELLFYNDGTFNTLIKDLKSLFTTHYDPAHSNLFYILIRIWTNGLHNADISNLNFYTSTFNMLVFAFSFVVMFKILNLIITNKKYIPVCLILAFFSTASVSTTLLGREYQLQGLGFLIVTYIFSKIFLYISENKNLELLSVKNICLYSFGIAFFLLTGYYSLIYTGLLALVLFFYIFKNIDYKKDFKTILKIFIPFMLLTLLIVFIVDRNYIGGGFHQDYMNSTFVSFSSWQKFDREIFTSFDILQKVLFYPVFIVYCLGVVLFAKFKKNDNSLMLLLFTIAFIWSLMVLLFAPYNDIRFFLPAVPVLALGFVYFLQSFDFKYSIISCLIFLIFIFIPQSKFDNFDTVRPFIFYVHDQYKSVFKNTSKFPMVFKDSHSTIPSFILYSDDEQKIMFVDKIPNKNFIYKKYILFFLKENLEKYYPLIQKSNRIVDKGCTWFNDCYVVIDNK